MRSFSAAVAAGPRRVIVLPRVMILTLCAELDSELSCNTARRILAVMRIALRLFD